MGDVSAEPSMEDILSSIKRIIAEDGDAAPARGRRVARGNSTPPRASSDEDTEVLDLNQFAADADEGEPMESATPAPVATGPLISPNATEASRGSLDALTRLIARPETHAAPATTGPTLEVFVADALRPLLREWLDAHLPELVEAMVAKEIARITGHR